MRSDKFATLSGIEEEPQSRYYVYLHSRPSREVYYVGKGSGGRSHDFKNNRNIHHVRTTKKIGKENVMVSVFPCADENHAFEMEIMIIDLLRTAGHSLTNMTNGGDGVRGYVITDEVRLKLSEKQRGKILPPEQRRKMSESHKGRKFSEETRKKISDALKGKAKSHKARENMAVAHAGLSWSKKRREAFERKKNEQ